MTDPVTDTHHVSADIVIFGGGIAGLWILNQLASLGYSVLLLESSALGNGQSIASQGIIHGGLKYALSGSVSDAALAIAGMPDRWRRALAGTDPVNLAGCRLLSDRYFMWSEGSYRSRLKAFLGSRSLRGRVEAIDSRDYPEPLSEARGQGSLYQLPDFVIDTGSLLQTLAEQHADRIRAIDPERVTFHRTGEGTLSRVEIATNRGPLIVAAQRFVLAAGEGNARLMGQAGLVASAMQRRPLNMVMMRKRELPRLYVHCIGDSFSLTPKLTVTTHDCADGGQAWYLGGELAEAGVDRSDDEQLQAAAQAVKSLFPWVDLTGADWACLRINRAEGREEGRHRPDSVFLKAEQQFLVAWPTKFTLSPALADAVSSELTRQQILPQHRFEPLKLAEFLGPVRVAVPPWETCFA